MLQDMAPQPQPQPEGTVVPPGLSVAGDAAAVVPPAEGVTDATSVSTSGPLSSPPPNGPAAVEPTVSVLLLSESSGSMISTEMGKVSKLVSRSELQEVIKRDMIAAIQAYCGEEIAGKKVGEIVIEDGGKIGAQSACLQSSQFGVFRKYVDMVSALEKYIQHLNKCFNGAKTDKDRTDLSIKRKAVLTLLADLSECVVDDVSPDSGSTGKSVIERVKMLHQKLYDSNGKPTKLLKQLRERRHAGFDAVCAILAGFGSLGITTAVSLLANHTLFLTPTQGRRATEKVANAAASALSPELLSPTRR